MFQIHKDSWLTDSITSMSSSRKWPLCQSWPILQTALRRSRRRLYLRGIVYQGIEPHWVGGPGLADIRLFVLNDRAKAMHQPHAQFTMLLLTANRWSLKEQGQYLQCRRIVIFPPRSVGFMPSKVKPLLKQTDCLWAGSFFFGKAHDWVGNLIGRKQHYDMMISCSVQSNRLHSSNDYSN
jgi:hypothetical protein